MTTLYPPSDDGLQLDLYAAVPDGAYDGADQANENAEPDWREGALAEIANMARSGYEFTADDLRERVGEPDHPNRLGGVFLAARRMGLITPTGQVRPSAVASRHGCLNRVWVGVRGAAA